MPDILLPLAETDMQHLTNHTTPLDTAIGHERPTTQLVRIFVDKKGDYSFGWDVTYFHISDEPKATSLNEYKACYEIISELVDKSRIIDAMSNRIFYDDHVLERPIPSTSKIDEFLELNIPDLWTYYCCDGREKVSNRFLAMPSYRTRVLGLQLYKYNIQGFLHWGYKFYFSQFSLRKLPLLSILRIRKHIYS